MLHYMIDSWDPIFNEINSIAVCFYWVVLVFLGFLPPPPPPDCKAQLPFLFCLHPEQHVKSRFSWLEQHALEVQMQGPATSDVVIVSISVVVGTRVVDVVVVGAFVVVVVVVVGASVVVVVGGSVVVVVVGASVVVVVGGSVVVVVVGDSVVVVVVVGGSVVVVVVGASVVVVVVVVAGAGVFVEGHTASFVHCPLMQICFKQTYNAIYKDTLEI